MDESFAAGVDRDARLFGRERELARLSAAVAAGGLTTLVGPGGAGKTRLALELVERYGERRDAQQGERHDERKVVWLSLAACRTGDEAAGRLASALGVSLSGAPGDDDALLAAALLERAPLLLVLDEAEGCAEALAPRLRAWCGRSSRSSVCVVVTSRRSLALPGERVLRVDGLEEAAAISLLEARARLAIARPLAHAEREALRPLLARVDALPLGIELLAAGLAQRPPSDLAHALARGEDVLGRAAVDGASTSELHARVRWSLELLSTEARADVAALAPLAGPFDLDTAAALLATTVADARVRVTALVDRSLLRFVQPRGGELRYALFEVVREVVREIACAELETKGELTRWAESHARWFALRGRALAVELHEGDGPSAKAALDAIFDELLTALRAAPRLEPDMVVGLVAGLDAALMQRGPVALHAEVLETAMAHTRDESPARVDALWLRARARFLRGHQHAALDDVRAARALAERLGDKERIRDVLLVQSAIERECGAPQLAEELATRTLALAADDPRIAARSLHNRAAARTVGGKLDGAGDDYLAALALAREVGAHRVEALCLVNLGVLAVLRGDLEVAGERAAEAADAFTALGETMMAGKAVALGADVATRRGALDEATALAQRAFALASQHGDRATETQVRLVEAKIASARGEGGRARVALEDVIASGRHLGLPELVAEAEGLLPSASAPPSSPRRAPTDSTQATSSTTILVGGGAYWFSRGTDPRVDLSRRPSLRRILARLVELRLTEPGRATSALELIDVGWPGEKVLPEAGAERVYTAIRTLRGMGLKGVLLRRDGGYAIDPAAAVTRSEG